MRAEYFNILFEKSSFFLAGLAGPLLLGTWSTKKSSFYAPPKGSRKKKALLLMAGPLRGGGG